MFFSTINLWLLPKPGGVVVGPLAPQSPASASLSLPGTSSPALLFSLPSVEHTVGFSELIVYKQ